MTAIKKKITVFHQLLCCWILWQFTKLNSFCDFSFIAIYSRIQLLILTTFTISSSSSSILCCHKMKWDHLNFFFNKNISFNNISNDFFYTIRFDSMFSLKITNTTINNSINTLVYSNIDIFIIYTYKILWKQFFNKNI